jgi:hypothetical protein
MQFSICDLSFALLTGLSTAAPPSLDARQGGSFVSVGNKYTGPGCTQLIFADPILGMATSARTLIVPALARRSEVTRRFAMLPVALVSCSCSLGIWQWKEESKAELTMLVTIYTGANCTGTAFVAPVGGCVTGDSPFVSTFVTCV